MLLCLAMTSVKFQFKGKSAHAAASPSRGRSALDAVELMDIGMNFMREHVDSGSEDHYVITKGGAGSQCMFLQMQRSGIL